MEFTGLIEIIAVVITAVIAVAGTAFSNRYKALKNLLQTLGDALEDDKLTKEEVQTIYKQVKKLF